MPNKYLDSEGLAEYTGLVKSALNLKADLASPALTGTPTAPTPTAGDNSTKVATTEFVNTKASDYLPLAGGTMTGSLFMTGANNRVVGFDVNNNGKNFDAGWNFENRDGAGFALRSVDFGGNNSTDKGSFHFWARNATASPELVGKPDGTLTWNGNNIALAKDYLPLSGGTMTGNVTFANSRLIHFSSKDEPSGSGGWIGSTGSGLRITSESWGIADAGVRIEMCGKNYATSPSQFSMSLTDSTQNKTLILRPDGTFIWGGKEIERVNAIGSDYIRYESGLQICWGEMSVPGTAVADDTITFPQAFKSSSSYQIGISRFWAYNSSEDYCIKSYTATGFTWSSIGTVSSNSHGYRYVAIGYWK